jgi:hypothetical protein
LFVGAGLSTPSGIPSWPELLADEAGQLGVIIQQDDNLPAVAQWIVNKYVGNRGPLINRVRTALAKHTGPNHYHTSIAHSAADTIWTTNYDTLIEDAFAHFSLAVRSSDPSIAHPADGAEVEIIKMHGCLSRSGNEDLVITKEDYEDFFHRRPATAERLRSDLLRRTFLFVGYGFGDPNIENIIVEARRLAKNATRRHHLVQKRVSSAIEGGQRALRQTLWVSDLRRIGIECTLIDNYEALQDILDSIALQSRGPTLYVTGSHEVSGQLAREVGSRLAQLRSPVVTIIDGQSAGLSRDVITAFTEECVNQGLDLRSRLRIFPNPYAANPAFSNDVRFLPMLKSLRRTLLRTAQAVMTFDGGMGTKMEVELALSQGCRVIPVPRAPGDYADDLLRRPEIANVIEARSPDYLAAWEKGQGVSAEDVASCVAAMIQ